MANEKIPMNDAEIVLYQPDDNIQLEVRVEHENREATSSILELIKQKTLTAL